MRLLSSKKICILIAAAGMLFVGLLAGTALIMQGRGGRTFPEEGYILTMEQDEEQIVVNRQNWFTAGTSWSRSGAAYVSFRDSEGGQVLVDEDSFVHYGSNSLGAVKDGSIADMDSYLEGIIGCYYLPAGNVLTWDGSGYTAESAAGEQHFSNFIWKNSGNRYLFGSPKLTITFSDGGTKELEGGFLELYYMSSDKKILQFTDGENAWQVVAKGCLVTLENGVTLDCESGKLLWPEGTGISGEAAAEESAGGSYETLTLWNMDADAGSSTVLGNQYSDAAPSFRFTLFDGQDGSSGADGESGPTGQAGEAGEDGETGAEGQIGSEGDTGRTGQGGGTDPTVINGGVDPGVDVYTGQPVLLTPEEDWTLSGEKLNLEHPAFSLAYDSESYENIDLAPDSAYIYLYNIKTGEIIQEWRNQNIPSEDEGTAPYTLDEPLAMDTTYGLAVVDTYTLGGTTYTTKLLDRIFTTDTTGVSVSLTGRAEDSFTMGVQSDAYTQVNKVTVTLTDPDGNVIEEEYEGLDDFANLTIGTKDGGSLESNTYYQVKVTVDSKVNGADSSNSFDFSWSTLKKRPDLGGLTLRAEDGYLAALAAGSWDADENAYKDVSDPDQALESVVYAIYDGAGMDALQRNETAVPLMTETSLTGGWVYFKVDGELLKNDTTYYVIADYTWNNGSASVTMAVPESNPSGVSHEEGGHSISSNVLKRAFAYAEARKSSGVNISFDGSGTRLYNLADRKDTTEGTTYETIAGSLMVNLNGLTVSVSDVHKLDLIVTDNQTYEKKFSFNSCDGKQGNIEGSFVLPLDLDGLLMGNTYALALKGYVTDGNLGTCEYRDIGSIALRTDASADIVMGMKPATNGGTGVEFWLGDTAEAIASNLINYYDKSSGEYYEDAARTTEGTNAYFENTAASYRNLSSIVFELYTYHQAGSGETYEPQPEDLLGTCQVQVTDGAGEKRSFMPGYSPLYQEFYGEAAFDGGRNNVGVGDSFTYQFEYNEGTTKKTGVIPESDLPQLSSSGSFTIRVRMCYDYTYDRYNYSGFDDLYDYYLPSAGLDMEDYINELTVNGGVGCMEADMKYSERPVSPNDVTKNGYAVSVMDLSNDSMGAYNGRTNNALFDAAFLEDTAVGLSVSSYYKDPEKETRSATFYGSSYEVYEKQWSADQSLSVVRDATYTDEDGEEQCIFGFKFTFPMTKNGAEDGEAREDMPKLYLLMYDETDEILGGWLEAQNYDETAEGDRGYSYRKYDSTLDAWIVYTSTDFLQRGRTYVFAYDAELEFQGTEFAYPSDYYDRNWIAGKKYAKNTVLRSQYISLKKQEPQVNFLLTDTECENRTVGGTDIWQVYLNDPDRAVLPETLFGENEDYEAAGGIYDSGGNMLTNNQSTSFAQYINVAFKDKGGNEHGIIYQTGDNSIYGTMDNLPLENFGDDEKAFLEELFEEMRQVTEDGGDVKAGTEIQFRFLCPDGVFYSWKVGYRLVDDYEPEGAEGLIPLVEHQYGGIDKWSINSGTLNIEAENGAQYTIASELDEATNNLVSVTFDYNNIGWGVYSKAMRRIAAVEIRAEKKEGDTWTPIYAKDEEGSLTDEPMTIWSTMAQETGENLYGFQFNISDFDQSQFCQGDELRFTYTLYYDGGERSFDESDIEKDAYYALKSVNIQYTSEKNVNMYGVFSTRTSLRFRNQASQSIYKLGSEITFTKTTAQSNRGETYLTELLWSYRVTENPTEDKVLEESEDGIQRTELLAYGANEEGYRTGAVTELCKLDQAEGDFTLTVEPIAPTLKDYELTPGLTQLLVDLSIDSYNLMTYPAPETLHLYYAVYRVDTVEEHGETLEKLSLAGVMIGEKDQSGEERQVLMDGLEKDTTYRLYIYYKDNREGDARTDAQIFGSRLPEAGTFVTGTEAEALARCFTRMDEDTGTELNPASNDEVNGIRKIMGYNEVIVQRAGYDEAGNPTPAIRDYYEEFTTLKGIVIEELKATLGYTMDYLSRGSFQSKTMTFSATTKFIQDEYTKLYFVLERCPVSQDRNNEENWRTVLADNDYPTDADVNPQFRPWDEAVARVAGFAKNKYQFYGKDYSYTPLTQAKDGTVSYTASMSLTYYPGYAMAPGYAYRVRALIFQYDGEDDTEPELVSLASANRDTPYKTTGFYTWNQYNYDALDLPVKVTNVERGETTLTASIKASYLYNYLDKRYYLRLCKLNAGGTWEILEEDTYYGTASRGTTWNKCVLFEGASYKVSFQNLDSDTTYALRFYGLIDTDYDNHVNIMSQGVPLAANDTRSGGTVYTDLEAHYSQSMDGDWEEPENRLPVLYEYYFGNDSYNDASKLDISAAANADQVRLCTSQEMRTFQKGQLGTIGEYYQKDVDTARNTLRLYFDGASGLNQAAAINYTISYFDPNGASQTETVSGQVIKGSNASPMDGGETSGNVTLTITNDRLQLSNKGTYYVQLELLTEDGTFMEKPGTIEFVVD